MKIAPNRTRREICSFDRLRGISKQIYLSFYYISNIRYCSRGRLIIRDTCKMLQNMLT